MVMHIASAVLHFTGSKDGTAELPLRQRRGAFDDWISGASSGLASPLMADKRRGGATNWRQKLGDADVEYE